METKENVVAIRGKPSTKIVNGQSRNVVPFVGADRAGKYSQVGVGLIYPDDETWVVWGLAIPHSIIQSWRGMKILERLGEIEHGTLCGCWYAAKQNPHEVDVPFINSITELVGGTANLQELQRSVLVSAPSASEINSMITNLRNQEVDVCCSELKEEIESGRIETSPLIETVIREDEEYWEAYWQEREEKSRENLAAQESIPLELTILQQVLKGFRSIFR